MWLYTKLGFFSVVNDRDASHRFWIRARRREHLEALRSLADIYRGTPAINIGNVVETPHADYQFRAMCARPSLEKLVVLLVQQIDYPNFKDAVEKTGQIGYHDMLHDVWHETKYTKTGRAR